MEVTPEGEKKGQAKEVGSTEAGEDLGTEMSKYLH